MILRAVVLAIAMVGAACRDSAKQTAASDVPPQEAVQLFSREFLLKGGFQDVGYNQLEWKGVKCSDAMTILEIRRSDLEHVLNSDPNAPSYQVRKHGWHFILSVVEDQPIDKLDDIDTEAMPTTIVDVLALPK